MFCNSIVNLFIYKTFQSITLPWVMVKEINWNVFSEVEFGFVFVLWWLVSLGDNNAHEKSAERQESNVFLYSSIYFFTGRVIDGENDFPFFFLVITSAFASVEALFSVVFVGG